MVKLFFYDQPYTDYRSAPYNQAYDPTQIGVMHDVAHVRSVIVDEAYRHSGMFLSLFGGMTVAAHLLGGRYLTAITDAFNADIAGLHRGAGITQLGACTQAGALVHSSLLAVEPMARPIGFDSAHRAGHSRRESILSHRARVCCRWAVQQAPQCGLSRRAIARKQWDIRSIPPGPTPQDPCAARGACSTPGAKCRAVPLQPPGCHRRGATPHRRALARPDRA